MSPTLRWLAPSGEDIAALRRLSTSAYSRQHSTYPAGLAGRSSMFDRFIAPGRLILSAENTPGNLIAAVGVAELKLTPAWLLSWVLSDASSAQLVRVWPVLMHQLCEHFEAQQRGEFYVVSPVTRTAAWRRLMRPVAQRYWNTVQRVIPAGETVDFPLYHSMMGNTTFDYAVKINLFVQK